MVTKRQLLAELDHRIDSARKAGDWKAAELYTATALRIVQTRDLALSGISHRIAAADARFPLIARTSIRGCA